MSLVTRMIRQAIRGKHRDERLGAITTLAMWFAVGAFATSTITEYVIPALSSNALTSAVGGAIALGVGVTLKLSA